MIGYFRTCFPRFPATQLVSPFIFYLLGLKEHVAKSVKILFETDFRICTKLPILGLEVDLYSYSAHEI